ncbi:MAG: acyl-CoA dehydrogenase family protein [Candidatus Brocadiaceae bacterium]|nr:acyl-CoA dehydrogenase family protein [Candidatus Brocadiaceae bacterium]
MELELTEEQKLLQKTLRDFAQKEILPGIIERDKQGEFPWRIIQGLARLGLMGMLIPEAYGGIGVDHLTYALAIEELARFDASIALTLSAHNSLGLSHIYKFGTEEQKGRFLPPLARGERLCAWALTEPQAGSDALAIETTAIQKGDKWILNGRKVFITQGSLAEVCVVMARTDKSRGKEGISSFIVEKGTAGFSVGKREEKLGMRCSDTAELIFEDCAIPKDNLLGRVNEGYAELLEVLEGGRIGMGAMAVGIARGCLEEALMYSKQRKQFGKPICDFQAIQWMLTDMATEIDAARMLVHKAAWLKDQGKRCPLEASQAKLFASEVAMRAAIKAVQILGGYGYMKECHVERYFRDAKLCEIGEGTSEVQRLVISRELLK